MNPGILTILVIVLLLVVLGSVALSLYLIYDLKSGNYRKFLAASDKHNELSNEVKDTRMENLGN